MNELDLTGNCLADQFFSFVKKKFVFFKKVVSMGINGDDERSEMTDAAVQRGSGIPSSVQLAASIFSTEVAAATAHPAGKTQ